MTGSFEPLVARLKCKSIVNGRPAINMKTNAVWNSVAQLSLDFGYSVVLLYAGISGISRNPIISISRNPIVGIMRNPINGISRNAIVGILRNPIVGISRYLIVDILRNLIVCISRNVIVCISCNPTYS